MVIGQWTWNHRWINLHNYMETRWVLPSSKFSVHTHRLRHKTQYFLRFLKWSQNFPLPFGVSKHKRCLFFASALGKRKLFYRREILWYLTFQLLPFNLSTFNLFAQSRRKCNPIGSMGRMMTPSPIVKELCCYFLVHASGLCFTTKPCQLRSQRG